MIGVALGTLIPHVVVAVGVLPIAMRRVLGIGLRDYYVSTYLRPFLATVPFAASCYVVDRFVSPSSLRSFVAVTTLALVAYVVPCWYVALTATERRAVAARISAMFKRTPPAVRTQE